MKPKTVVGILTGVAVGLLAVALLAAVKSNTPAPAGAQEQAQLAAQLRGLADRLGRLQRQVNAIDKQVEEWKGEIRREAPSADAKEACLSSDLQTLRSQIELYKVQHGERNPSLKEDGTADTANFVNRMTGKTDQYGKLDAAGQFGPYLCKFPTNPFAAKGGDAVTFGTADPAPGAGNGWYFNTSTGKFSANDPAHTGL